MRYEWDGAKAGANLRKHGVAFEDAIAALEDPRRLERIDSRLGYGEDRLQVLGMAQSRVLLVIATLRGEDTCRVISARKATRHEEERYHAGDEEGG